MLASLRVRIIRHRHFPTSQESFPQMQIVNGRSELEDGNVDGATISGVNIKSASCSLDHQHVDHFGMDTLWST